MKKNGEFTELIQMVSQKIVLYASPERVNVILNCLIEIAKQATPDATDSQDKTTTKLIQKNIFTIINELAEEIGLGGEINSEIENKLNILDDLVLQKTTLK